MSKRYQFSDKSLTLKPQEKEFKSQPEHLSNGN